MINGKDQSQRCFLSTAVLVVVVVVVVVVVTMMMMGTKHFMNPPLMFLMTSVKVMMELHLIFCL